MAYYYHWMTRSNAIPLRWKQRWLFSPRFVVVVVVIVVEKLSPHFGCAPLICFFLLRLFYAFLWKCLANFGQKNHETRNSAMKQTKNINATTHRLPELKTTHLMMNIHVCYVKWYGDLYWTMLNCFVESAESTATKWIHFMYIFVTHSLECVKRTKRKMCFWPSEFCSLAFNAFILDYINGHKNPQTHTHANYLSLQQQHKENGKIDERIKMPKNGI